MNAILCDMCGKQLKEANNYLVPFYQVYNLQSNGQVV